MVIIGAFSWLHGWVVGVLLEKQNGCSSKTIDQVFSGINRLNNTISKKSCVITKLQQNT